MQVRNRNSTAVMQIVPVVLLSPTVLLILLLSASTVASFTATATHNSRLRNRRFLHQPFFPSNFSPEPVNPPAPSPQPHPSKHPTTTASTDTTPTATTTTTPPFFPVYQTPPPPSPPPPSPTSPTTYAALPTFPANISSLVVPNSHSSPTSSHSRPSLKLIIISVILCLLAVSLLVSLALLHRRHSHRNSFNHKHHHTPPSDDTRLYPSGSVTSDINPLPPPLSKPSRPGVSNTSTEFLYLGTIAASTHSREFENQTNLESPEIRPLPPLPRKPLHLSRDQTPTPTTTKHQIPHYEDNEEEDDDDATAVVSFYSPVGSSGRLRRLCSTSSSRAIEVLERDIYLENQNYSPISTSSSPTNSKPSPTLNSISQVSNPSSPGGMSTPSPMEVRLPTLRHPINQFTNGKESGGGLSVLFREDTERLSSFTTDTENTKVKVQVQVQPPPPPPPPPLVVGKESVPGPGPGPPPLPRPWRSFSSGEQERVKSGEVSKPKLKRLHWDKFRASSDRAMVWDQLKPASFPLNEELIETLFTVNGPNMGVKDSNAKRLNMPSLDQEYRVLDPKKSQNIAILLRALNVTVEEVCDALIEGNAEMLGPELLESLLKMAPTKDEEFKLKQYKDESPVKLGAAEKFLKAIIDIPFAFKRIEAMLYVANFDSEAEYLRKSFDTLEIACEELKNCRMFLKLLEAVLNTGNRMNNGTNRGDARAFKLDTLLKLVYIKGTDGKTTLLHFVVYEIIKAEGCRVSQQDADDDSRRLSLQDDIESRKRGLEIIAGLGSELANVKKAAGMDYETLGIDVGKLARGLTGVAEAVKLSEQLQASNNGNITSKRFGDSMSRFLNKAGEEIRKIAVKESSSLARVKALTEYFHGNSVEEEAHPLRIFVVVRDFLSILDTVCKEVGKLNERKVVSSSSHPVPMPLAALAPGEED